MTKDVVIIGAGGFGREVLDLIENWNQCNPDDAFNILGVVDDAPSQINLDRIASRGFRYLGPVSELVGIKPVTAVIVAVGNPLERRRVFNWCIELGLNFPTLVHPSAVLGTESNIGQGVVVCAGVVISTNVTLGDHVHLCAKAVIGHDVNVSAFSSINPGAVVSGEVSIGENTLIGAGAVILQGITIGQQVTIGASACVTKDVPANNVFVGVPARPINHQKDL